MKNPIFLILTFGLVLGRLNLQAGNSDTLTLSEYLKIFDKSFTSEFNLGWYHLYEINAIKLSYDNSKQLINKKIKFANGAVLSPEISGWAYSYKRLNAHIFWLVFYSEGESGTSFLLCILDTEKKTISKPYQLANTFGDQGDWAYKYGKFENDSTYQYKLVYGSEDGTHDSIFIRDRIRLTGESYQLSKKNLKK